MADKHIKPTTEELEKDAQKAAEEADRIKAEEEAESEEEESAEEEEAESEEEESAEEEAEEAPDSKEKDPNYKEKFIESAREAIVVVSKNKKLNKAIDEASSIAEPTDEEMRQVHPDYDDFTSTEKKLAKSGLVNEKRFALIQDANKESKDIEAWNVKVDEFVGDPKTLVDNPDLEGKVEEFKIFSMKPSRRGVSFEDLVRSFLYDATKSVPKKKGKMFEEGSGGERKKVKQNTGKITIEQARKLRVSNYPKYKEYLKADKIESIE